MTVRVTFEQKLSVRCPRCSAEPGKECTATPYVNVRRNTISIGFAYRLSQPHKDRRQVFLDKEQSSHEQQDQSEEHR